MLVGQLVYWAVWWLHFAWAGRAAQWVVFGSAQSQFIGPMHAETSRSAAGDL
jgi:hypothetical protein